MKLLSRTIQEVLFNLTSLSKKLPSYFGSFPTALEPTSEWQLKGTGNRCLVEEKKQWPRLVSKQLYKKGTGYLNKKWTNPQPW